MPPTNHNATIGERLAALEANYEHLERKTEEVSRDVKVLLEYVQQAKGGWKTLVAVASIGGVVGGVLAKVGVKWV